MRLKTAWNHVSWLFFPKRFLFSGKSTRNYRVPGWETLRFVDTQAELQDVTKATGDVFLGGAGNAFLESLFGAQSVFRLDHDRHQLARQICGGALARCSGTEHAGALDRYINEALDAAPSRRLVALSPWSRALTMRAMCKLVLDIDDATTARRFFRRFEATTGFLANFVSYSKFMWHPRGKFSIGSIVARVVEGVNKVVVEAIRERKAAGATGETPLDALIRGQKTHGYDDGFIRDNVVSLLAAGYETTGSAIAWMLYWLSQKGVYADLRAKRASGDAEYLTAFRKECLRYCPPIEILPRKVAADRCAAAVQILPDLAESGDDHELPMVCPFVHRVHHDSSVYADPNQFDPERFRGRNYRPTEYLPFGLGRRFCLGASVGQRLMDRTAEGMLDRELRFELLSPAFSPVRRNVTIWPGLFLYARPKQDTNHSHE